MLLSPRACSSLQISNRVFCLRQFLLLAGLLNRTLLVPMEQAEVRTAHQTPATMRHGHFKAPLQCYLLTWF